MPPPNSMVIRKERDQDNTGSIVLAKKRNSAYAPVYFSDEAVLGIVNALREWCSKVKDLLKSDKLLRCCHDGDLEGMKELVRIDPGFKGPDLDSELHPTPGYISHVIIGAHNSSCSVEGVDARHGELIQYLCELGCSVDYVDPCGGTAFFYCFLFKPRLELAKKLLDNGANVNHLFRGGLTPIRMALESRQPDAINFLLDNGADHTLGETDFVMLGTDIFKVGTIAVESRRNDSWTEIPCTMCKKPRPKLQSCGRCRLAQYCSKECQRAHWKDHKPTCFGSLEQKVVIVKPDYTHFVGGSPNAVLMDMYVHRASTPETLHEIKRRTKDFSRTNMRLRIQVDPSRSIMFIFDRHKTFTCAISKDDNPGQFAELLEFISEKGVPAYPGGPAARVCLLADLKQRDELVFKLGNVLEDNLFDTSCD